jgi:DNA-binding phage protein
MHTKQTLADLLMTVPVEDVARESGLSTKTIYRLRNQEHAPRLDTIESVVAAVKRIAPRRRPRAKAAA